MRQFRTANLKDDCTRECPAIVADLSLPGRRVVEMLDAMAAERGYPDMPVVDNDPKLRGRELDRWAHDHGVRPGKRPAIAGALFQAYCWATDRMLSIRRRAAHS